MKRCLLLVFVTVILLLMTCSCLKRGPYPAPIHQSSENVVKIDIMDGRKERALYYSETYQDYVIYSLKPEEFAPFIDGLKTIEFYTPLWEPDRSLGFFVVWIYYADGNIDVIGTICTRYYDSEMNYLDYGVNNPDDESFYALVEQYVDPALLPRGWD